MKTTEQKQNYWFKPKPYGRGFMPISRQGRALVGAYLAMFFLIGYANYIFRAGTVSPNGQDIAMFGAEFVMISVLMGILANNNCSGRLGWRWGEK